MNYPSFITSMSPLPEDVVEAIRSIYTDLSNEKLLERCVGGFTRNNNESYNHRKSSPAAQKS